MKKRLAWIGIVTAFLMSVVIVPSASAAANDLVVITSSRSAKTIKVCKDWPDIPSNTMAKPCGGGTGYLPRGTNSQDRLGWKDADGIRVDRGYALRKAVSGPDQTIAPCRATTFWRKVSPSPFDPGVNEDYYYLWDCPAY